MATDREKLDNAARAMQMIVNTRLTALQAAQTLMATRGYTEIEGGGSASKVDHVTLLAIAQDVEKYILGQMEDELKAAMAAATAPKPTIVPAKTMP